MKDDIVIVTAGIIKKDNKILIAKRKEGHLVNKWEFPGGKLEPGETPKDCLKRELCEEFGIETKIGKYLATSNYEYPHIKIELIAYEVEYISGEFKLNDHQEIKWVKREELSNYDFAPADIPIVNKILGE
ncbi:MAG TPA: 8-oxo-dGTP diphosphatase MutT [Methanofastidiosum sp.]|nr:MAG: CTP pyrophosphohydrolase [Firmicutes bacterium ADurb.Bin080]HOE93293.1 8-oxo-dGTP diphosphatase MutT [Methanofastidiosum sp.]HPL72658.1 8-oxo-dGTP diphosphatase MutT [Candidatus Pacearchaeota archaeon]HOR88340.1 8-oxo-dGTP diphosphatase MutT [Methanofastidiosum sp.]HOT84644.1 8-oxo-dGTP diphosphatase MutT [Methanofastidiosum sp.]